MNRPRCFELRVVALAIFFVAIVSVVNAIADSPPSRRHGKVPIIGGTINGRSVSLLLDTGSAHCAVDEGILKSLHVATIRSRPAVTPSGEVQVMEYENVAVQLDGFPAHSIKPAGIDFTLLTAPTLVSFDAILGLEVLSHHVVVISDGTASVRNFVPSEVEVLKSLPMGRAEFATAMLPVVLPGLDGVDIGIDTGESSACRLNEELIAILKSNRQVVPGFVHRRADLRGTQVVTGLILREINVGGVQFRNVPITPAQDNVIGWGLLRHLNLALDFPQHQIIIGKPPKEVVDHFPQNASGMRVGFDADDQLKVTSILPECPAEKAGVQTGDNVILLDEKKPADLSIYAIDEILAQNGRTVPVRLRRGSDEFSVELLLHLPFEYPPNWARFDKELEDFERFLGEKEIESPTSAVRK